MKQLILVLLVMLNGSALFAQEAKGYIHEGNKLYQQKNYKAAEDAYRKATIKPGDTIESRFNLGAALYKEKKFDSAGTAFKKIAASTRNPLIKAGAYHNLGNALLADKKYDASIDAYKQALLNNPKDDQTRYNLAYAEEMLKKNKPPKNNGGGGGGGGGGSNKNKNNQNKNNQNKNKSNQDKSKGGGGGNDKSKSDKDKGNPDKNKGGGGNDQANASQQNQPANPNNVSKEDAQRMLNALDAEEKGTQDKLKGKRLQGVKTRVMKDW